MKIRVQLESFVLGIAMVGLGSSTTVRADVDPLVDFSHSCRDVTKAMLEHHTNPFESKVEFEQSLENVVGTLGRLRRLEEEGKNTLSPQEHKALKDRIEECSGALASALSRAPKEAPRK